MDGFWINDPEGRLLDVNDAYCAMTGYSREELLSLSVSHLEANENPEETRAHLQKVLATANDRFETRHRKKDGTIFDVEVVSAHREFGRGLYFVFLRDITDRKRAEDALRENEARLTEAQGIAHIGSWEWNMRNNTVKWSKEMYRVYDLDPAAFDLKPDSLLKVIHPDDVERFVGSMKSNLDAGNSPSLEYRVLHRDGSVHTIHVMGVTEIDESGRPVRSIGTAQDITERKQAEEELRTSEARWKFAVDGAGDGLWDWDVSGASMFYSNQYKAILGFDEGEIGRSVGEREQRIHPDDALHCQEELHRLFRGEVSVFRSRHRMLCKDGTYKWILERGTVIQRTGAGEVLRLIGIVTDLGGVGLIPKSYQQGDFQNRILVRGIEIMWDTTGGVCTFRGLPVALMWVDTTLAGLMSGVESMVGPERFALALQAEGRKSVESDWLIIAAHADFRAGFAAIAGNAAIAGWGDWQLAAYEPEQQKCVFRVFNNWEALYQKSLGVCWGNGMLAGKLAGICSKLFKTNCWAIQTLFLAKGDPCDEFVVTPSSREVEQEIADLLSTDQATKADMTVAIRKLQNTERDLRRVVAERTLAEEKVSKLVSEKELILREVHHRIKNNMNTVMSLLSLQAQSMKDPRSVAALNDARGRMQSMSLLYEKLYRSDTFRELSIKGYLIPLVHEIVGNFPNRGAVTIETDVDDFILDARQLSTLGIMLNELVTNAMKHAFMGRESGVIRVAATLAESRATVSVQDDGVGLPEAFDLKTSAGFGLRLIGMLTEQCGAAFRVERGDGTTFILELQV